MNKKILTGIMLLLVAGIWGYVGYNFFGGGPSGDDDVYIEEVNTQEITPIRMGKQEKLLLNYPDPFLKDEARPAVSIKKTSTQPVKTTPVKKEEKTVVPAYAWPNITYRGLIQNKTQPDKMIGVIVVNGQEKIIRKGEKIDELVVSNMEKGKVELAHEKEKKVFVKQF